MAIKKYPVFIEELGKDPYTVAVYSDLDVSQIQVVDGVSSVVKTPNFVLAYIDKRYDPDTVFEDIRCLTDPQPDRRSWGTIGKWTSVRDGLPKGGLYVTVWCDTPSCQPKYYAAQYKFCETGPNGARYEWMSTDHRVLSNVVRWTPIP